MLSMKGRFSVHDLYEWDKKLFARVGSSYVRLKTNGSTSLDTQLIIHMETEIPLWSDTLGRISVEPKEGYKQIAICAEHGDNNASPFLLEDKA